MKTDQQGYAAPLSAFGRADLATAGGKGANLGELVRQGFPVPDGFIVTTTAYGELVESHGLNTRILDLLADGDSEGSRIRQEITKATVPANLRQAVLDAYEKLGSGPVAVRSSATAEDLPGAAFAGQQDTYLNIVGPDEVVEAVRKCWASLWTERAISYRARQGIDPAEVRIAVVVQVMAPAEMAGVMFSANPVTGDRDEVVIDASSGLGEAVVSGLVTPDHYVLEKQRGKLKQWKPGAREVVIQSTAGGGTTETSGEKPDRPGLSKDTQHTLVRLATQVEQHFGAPQDMEWAYVDGQVHLLQARPITALPPPPVHLDRFRKKYAPFFMEMLSMRPYPLDVTTWMAGVIGGVGSMGGSVGMRLPTIDEIVLEQDGVVTRVRPPAPRPTWRVLKAPASLFRRARRYPVAAWEDDPRFAEYLRKVEKLRQTDLASQSWPQLLRRVDEAVELPQMIWELRIRYLPGGMLASARLGALLFLLGRRKLLSPLLSGARTKTSETNEELAKLARMVSTDDVLRKAFGEREPADLARALTTDPDFSVLASRLAEFEKTYGHRETASPLLVSQPTWADSPEILLGLVKALVGTERPEPSPHVDSARAELMSHPLLRMLGLRSRVQRTLEKARALLPAREDTHFYGTLTLPILRRVLLEIGQRLASAGVLDSTKDVFHLRWKELAAISDAAALSASDIEKLRETVHRRKALRAELADVPLLDMSQVYADTEATGDVLVQGTASSSGSATGRVRIIREASEFGRLKEGDVLVCPYTNPAWTPLFQRASAIVVDTGGLGSHAAITAREYGIPAVLGTGRATTALSEGALVQVDGTLGRVSAVRPEWPDKDHEPVGGEAGATRG